MSWLLWTFDVSWVAEAFALLSYVTKIGNENLLVAKKAWDQANVV